MSTKTRTAEEIFGEISELVQQVNRRKQADTAESWTELADIYDRERNLWRELGDVVKFNPDTPAWAAVAAYNSGDHCSDVAFRYREYARQCA